jgi:hypothetical protein
MVYIERRGGSYAWRLIGNAEDVTRQAAAAPLPDAWIFYAGAWPQTGAPGSDAFLTDLLEELDGGTGGQDRCRWPADDPWPHQH